MLTGWSPTRQLNVADPIAEAIGRPASALEWLETVVDIAAVIGLAATVLVTFYGQTRIFMRMSSDGMLPAAFGQRRRALQDPGVATLVCARRGRARAPAFTPIDVLDQLVSIGTLLSFVIVCGAVMVLRRTPPGPRAPVPGPGVSGRRAAGHRQRAAR